MGITFEKKLPKATKFVQYFCKIVRLQCNVKQIFLYRPKYIQINK